MRQDESVDASSMCMLTPRRPACGAVEERGHHIEAGNSRIVFYDQDPSSSL